MIFLSLIEIYLINFSENTDENLRETDNYDYNYIKNIIIICTFGSIIYLLLHQVNQNTDTVFKFEMYNKIIICIMIVDILICLFFISKYLINYGVKHI